MKTAMLSVKGVALASGITWAIAILLLPLVVNYLGAAGMLVDVFADAYKGYDVTVGGALIGAIYGFVDAGIGGAVFAWLYNKLA